MHSRMLRHRFVTGAVTLTLALGGVATTGAAASAAGAGADRAASAECQQARKDLAAAKKKLRAAKRSDKAGKIRKAQAKVRAAKAEKARACAAPATEESVLEQVQQGQLALDGLDTAQLTALLPPEAAAALGQVLAQLSAGLDGIGSQVPGADTAKLEALLASVLALDVPGVVAALEDLAATLTAGGATPASINTLVQMLQAGLPGGGSVPIQGIPELQAMLAQLMAQLPALGGLDLTDTAAVEAAIAQLVGDLEAIEGNVGGPSAGWLAALTDMVDQLGDLGALVPGGAGSGAVLTTILNTMLGLAQPGTDPLGQLQGILAGGQLGGILELLGLGDLLGGILGGIGMR